MFARGGGKIIVTALKRTDNRRVLHKLNKTVVSLLRRLSI